ncbi:MAG: YhjD/YihY/BrkB family envelope integrity protein [Pirellulaceae bacterium]
MIRRRLRPVIQWLKRVVTQPRHELDRWQKAVRFAYDLGRYGTRQLRNDRATQIAAALSFRTLFALFPVLVVCTILVRAIIGIDEFRAVVDSLLVSAFGDVRIVLPVDASSTSTTLNDWVDELIGEAATVNLVAIGWVGLAVVIYAAIGLMVTIENAFNTIYRAPGGRSWTRRVPLYWFLLTVSPVAMGLAAYGNGRFENWIESVEAWQWALVAARLAWGCFFGWLFMLAIYMLIPNTRVEARPALIGAFVSVVLLTFGMRTLGAYLENAFSISQLYGSLGLIPLFMFWVYLMWLAVLFGLEVSAILQMLRGRRLEEVERKRERTGLIDPAAVVTVMEIIAERFHSGHSSTADEIGEQTMIPQTTVRRILDRLMEDGFLHRLDTTDGTVCLATPPDQIPAKRLVDIGFELVDETGQGRRSDTFERLRQAQRSLVAEATLATLVPARAGE